MGNMTEQRLKLVDALNWRDASLMAMGTENDALRAVLNYAKMSQSHQDSESN